MLNRREFLELSVILIAEDLIFPKSVFGKLKRSLTEKIIKIESGGDPKAFNKETKARGLMQIRPIVRVEWNRFNPKKRIRKEELFDPYINVNVGCWYLYKRIKEHYLPHYKLEQHQENMAAAYNWGPVNLGRIGDATKNFERLPEETQNYLEKLRKLT